MIRLDRIDINILVQLQLDGRLTNVELASRVGLSPSPCLQRTKRLEKAGFITSYRAQVELAKIGDSVMVFTEVTLSDHRRNDFIKFEREIRRWESVVECHLVSGGVRLSPEVRHPFCCSLPGNRRGNPRSQYRAGEILLLHRHQDDYRRKSAAAPVDRRAGLNSGPDVPSLRSITQRARRTQPAKSRRPI